MKRQVLALCLAAAALGIWSAKADASDLSRDQRDACEALMCLAAGGSTPAECQPALRRYFSITARKPRDLVKKRRSFLEMCPSNTPSLINSAMNGGGGSGGNPGNPERPPAERQIQ